MNTRNHDKNLENSGESTYSNKTIAIDLSQYYSEHFNQSLAEIDETLVRKLVPYLYNQDDKIIWMGQPKRGIVLDYIDFKIITFTLLIIGVIVASNEYILQFSFSIADFLIGFIIFYVLIGRHLQDIFRRKNIYYAISDKQVFILNKSKITTLPIEKLTTVSLNEKRNGLGTIKFAKERKNSTFENIWLYFSRIRLTDILQIPIKHIPQFESIDNAREVYELIANPLLRTQREDKKGQI